MASDNPIQREPAIMTNRDWLCLALRLLGIWILIQAVEELMDYLIYVISTFNDVGDIRTLAFGIVWLIGRTALGLTLVLFAPAIATRFYPSAASSETSLSEFNETRALKVGIQLLAVYALLLAVQSAASVIYEILTSDSTSGSIYSEEDYLRAFLTCGLNLAFAGFLLIWNDQVITLIAKFRYVPERDAYEPPPIDE